VTVSAALALFAVTLDTPVPFSAPTNVVDDNAPVDGLNVNLVDVVFCLGTQTTLSKLS